MKRHTTGLESNLSSYSSYFTGPIRFKHTLDEFHYPDNSQKDPL